MPMPTIEAMITPTIMINAEIRRNRMLLKWSSISFLNIVNIPCNLGLLKILHIDLFKRVMFLIDTQLFLSQFLNGPDSHKIPFDHDPHSIANPLDLVEEVGGEKNGNIFFPAPGVDEAEHPIRPIRI